MSTQERGSKLAREYEKMIWSWALCKHMDSQREILNHTRNKVPFESREEAYEKVAKANMDTDIFYTGKPKMKDKYRFYIQEDEQGNLFISQGEKPDVERAE